MCAKGESPCAEVYEKVINGAFSYSVGKVNIFVT